jgi:hypothetical protein
MPAIKGLEAAEKILGPLKFFHFRRVRELRFLEQPGASESQLDLFVESQDRSPNFLLNLRFRGVQNLKLTFGGQLTQIIGFDISDISQRQWDRLNWEVTDFENGRIHFYCREVEILSARQA